jgi:hypothetical protein
MHFNLIAVTALIATLVNASAIRLIPRNMDITPELAKRETVTQAKMIGDAVILPLLLSWNPRNGSKAN